MDENQLVMDSATCLETDRLIDLALAEDLGSSDPANQLDVTTESVVPEHVHGSADFVTREPGIVCGVQVASQVIQRINRGVELQVHCRDGQAIQPGERIATLRGNAQDILVAERTCLNFMGRLSGIASMTHQYVQQIAGTRAQVLDTRKTTPGWRRLEKFAVSCGGGRNHRMGLFDAVLIKDNHLAMIDALTETPMAEVGKAISSARAWIEAHQDRLPNGINTIVQIEVDRLDQLALALESDVDIVLLDNMDLNQLRQAVALRDRQAPKILLEASGGVTLKTIRNIAQTGVDRISVGALTHSSVNLDIGLDWSLGQAP